MPTPHDQARRARAVERMAELYPDDAGARTAALVAGFSADLGELFVDHVFGDIYSRPALTLQQRQLVTLGCLVTLGDTHLQLQIQVVNSLNVGLHEHEIVEAIIHATIFAGWGRAVNAMAVARGVFAARAEAAAATSSPATTPQGGGAG